MKIKLIHVLLFSTLIFCTNFAQKTEGQNIIYSKTFDDIILKDTTLKVVKIASTKRSNGGNEYQQMLTVYNPEKVYDEWVIHKLICSNFINEKSKILFLTAALKDSSDPLFRHSYSTKCDCLKEQPIIRQLFSEYYKERANLSVGVMQYQYLDFILKNELNESLELMVSHLAKRDSLDTRYFGDTDFPLYLFKLGHENKALKVLDFFIKEVEKGRINLIRNRDFQQKENIFILLGLSKDKKIKNKAIELAFKYYSLVGGRSSDLIPFLKYVDLRRYKDSLKVWCKYYISFPFEDYTRNIKSRYRWTIGSEGLIIADEIGYPYWQSVVDAKQHWATYDFTGFEFSIIYIAKHVIKGKLSQVQKDNIISFLVLNNRFLNPESKLKDRNQLFHFMYVVRNAYPEMPPKEFVKYIPKRYSDYSWNERMKDYKRLKSAPTEKIKKSRLQHISESFINAGLIEKVALDDYDQFLYDIKKLSSTDFLYKTGRIISFDVEAGIYPVKYKDLFDTEFIELLLKAGIDFLTIHEERTVLNNQCMYQITIDNKQNSFKFNYTDNSDWYNPRLFIKAINLALIDKGVKTRLIAIETYDQVMQLGIFEPDLYLPVANELNMYSTALKLKDGLMSEY